MEAQRFKERMRIGDIRALSLECGGSENKGSKEELLTLACHEDDRIAYNALWVFTHFRAKDIKWLDTKRDLLIDLLLGTEHTKELQSAVKRDEMTVGKQRLILTLMEHLAIPKEEIRTDYLDFCLSKINSTAPCAIRALSLKQAFRMCRHYPELLEELCLEMDLMTRGQLSPGLLSAIRTVRRHLVKL